jgi:hypothetical protein
VKIEAKIDVKYGSKNTSSKKFFGGVFCGIMPPYFINMQFCPLFAELFP